MNTSPTHETSQKPTKGCQGYSKGAAIEDKTHSIAHLQFFSIRQKSESWALIMRSECFTPEGMAQRPEL